jgi:hypothetical protein
MLSGDVVWCSTCGSYADGKAVGLAAPCAGPPAKNGYGGMWGQLRKLRNGKHPRSGALLAPPVSEFSGAFSGVASQHTLGTAVVPALVAPGGRSATEKALEMRLRVRAKAAAAL